MFKYNGFFLYDYINWYTEASTAATAPVKNMVYTS